MAKPAAPEDATLLTDPKATRLTVSPTLDQETYDKIKKLAEEDERTMAQWVARYLRQQLKSHPGPAPAV